MSAWLSDLEAFNCTVAHAENSSRIILEKPEICLSFQRSGAVIQYTAVQDITACVSWHARAIMFLNSVFVIKILCRCPNIPFLLSNHSVFSKLQNNYRTQEHSGVVLFCFSYCLYNIFHLQYFGLVVILPEGKSIDPKHLRWTILPLWKNPLTGCSAGLKTLGKDAIWLDRDYIIYHSS